jgi:hypothetical protein
LDDAFVLLGGGFEVAALAMDGAEQEAGHDEIGIAAEGGFERTEGSVVILGLIFERAADIEAGGVVVEGRLVVVVVGAAGEQQSECEYAPARLTEEGGRVGEARGRF